MDDTCASHDGITRAAASARARPAARALAAGALALLRAWEGGMRAAPKAVEVDTICAASFSENRDVS
jgi:hypothetical protein